MKAPRVIAAHRVAAFEHDDPRVRLPRRERERDQAVLQTTANQGVINAVEHDALMAVRHLRYTRSKRNSTRPTVANALPNTSSAVRDGRMSTTDVPARTSTSL